jgi:predicted transcriptional regulator
MTINTEKPRPTEAELEILAVLWKEGPSTVRFVNDILKQKREIGYTTTLKILQIMADKGLVSRELDGRTHVYAAAISQKDTQEKLIGKLMDSVFGGSAGKLVMSALGQNSTSVQELEEIRKYIQELQKSKK